MSLMNYGFTKSVQPNPKNPPSQSNAAVNPKMSEDNLKSEEKIKTKSPTISPIKKTVSSPKPKNSPQIKDSNTLTPVRKISPKKPADDDEGLSYSPFAHKSASDLSLPPQRVKMIMKSCPDVEIVPQEALHIITKATELFIQNLAQESLDFSQDKYRLDYESLSSHVHSSSSYEFLKETVPKKLTLADCQQIIARNRAKMDNTL